MIAGTSERFVVILRRRTIVLFTMDAIVAAVVREHTFAPFPKFGTESGHCQNAQFRQFFSARWGRRRQDCRFLSLCPS